MNRCQHYFNLLFRLSIFFFIILFFGETGTAQTCPNVSQGNWTGAYDQNDYPIVGQRFIPTCTGAIQDIRVATGNFTTAGSGTLNLHQIVGGAAGSPIATASYFINAHFMVFTITLPTPIVVTSGQEYMFLLVQGTENTQWLASTANPYSGGDSVVSTTSNTANVSNSSGIDMLFQVTYQPVMPVELTQFQAKSQEDGVHLNWETASELNNAGFTIQRAVPAINGEELVWKNLGFVKGEGTSDTKQFYTFLDDNPLVGKQLYRLRQEDLDGAVNYSDIEVVYFEKRESPLTVYPNPTYGVINLPTLKAGDSLHIFNQQGQVIGIKTLNSNGQIIMENLPSGIYFIQSQSSNTSKMTRVVLDK